MIKKQDGVWLADPRSVIHLTEKDMDFLEGEAPLTVKKCARICAHAVEDRAHLMLIAFCAGSHVEMHFHHKPESIIVLAGCLSVQIEGGELYTLYPYHFLRIPAGVRHQPAPITDCVVLEIAEK